MEEIGIFFGSNTGQSEKIALQIKSSLPPNKSAIFNIKKAAPKHFNLFKTIIIISPTWGNGDLQDDWVDFESFISDINFEDKIVAFVGVGDQITYQDTFADAIGLLYDQIAPKAKLVIGQTESDTYNFQASKALRDGRFIGLIIDEENQADLTNQRINSWIANLNLEF